MRADSKPNDDANETDDALDYDKDGWHWTSEAGHWRPGDGTNWRP